MAPIKQPSNWVVTNDSPEPHIASRASNMAGARFKSAGARHLPMNAFVFDTIFGEGKTGDKQEPKAETVADSDQALVDAKIAVSEARTDAKFARMDGKLDAIVAELRTLHGDIQSVRTEVRESREDNRQTRGTVRNTGLALAALIVACVTLLVGIVFALPAVYSLGASTRDIIQSEVQKALPAKPAGQ